MFTTFAALLVWVAQPIQPDTNPILRIETGMHAGEITALAVDAAGKWVVTGGADKTIRVWTLPTGNLVRVIRPPIERGSDEGKLFTVAMSSDGQLIAAGGDLGAEYGKKRWIAMFRRATGEMIGRYGAFADVAAIAFSRDDKRVAAVDSAGNLQVFDVKTGALSFGEDKLGHWTSGKYDHGLWFGPDGTLRFVTNSLGRDRLYDASGSKQQECVCPDRHGQCSFSLDGSKLIARDEDHKKLTVYSACGAKLFDVPSVLGKDDYYSAPAWSRDGRMLVAVRWQRATGNQLWYFGDGGKGGGTKVDLSAATAVRKILTTATGVVWYSEDGWGYVDLGLRERVVHRATKTLRWQVKEHSTRAPTPDFVTTASGAEVYVRPLEGNPFAVVPKERTVKVATELPLPSARKELWDDSVSWRRGFSMSPDAKAAAVVSLLSLGVRIDGKTAWTYPEGATDLVHWSDDGKVIVAVFRDGVLRWFRATDGELLLSWFALDEGKRWVAWTKSGYFDASPDGETLVGWHVNRGLDAAADFYPAQRMRKHFYRPDVVSAVLDTLDEKKAIEQVTTANSKGIDAFDFRAMQPPIVVLVPSADEIVATDPTLRLVARVRTPSNDSVNRVWAVVDGRQVDPTRGIKPKQATGDIELTVPIPPRDVLVSVFAATASATSEPVNVQIRWRGKQASASFEIKPTLYVLSIGVGKYKDPGLQLDFAAKDATDVAAALEKQAGKLYKRVERRVLTDELATRDEILDALDWLQKSTTQHDMAMLFLAGHGMNEPQSGQFYFLPHDADVERMKRTMIADTDIRSTVATIAGKVLLFLDACHSGNVAGKSKFRGSNTDINGFVNELASADNGVVVFTSSTGRQLSQESPEWKNGAFTLALLEGLSGKADALGSGRVTVNMLDLYVSERVKALTRGAQTPSTAKPSTIQDFPVAISR